MKKHYFLLLFLSCLYSLNAHNLIDISELQDLQMQTAELKFAGEDVTEQIAEIANLKSEISAARAAQTEIRNDMTATFLAAVENLTTDGVLTYSGENPAAANENLVNAEIYQAFLSAEEETELNQEIVDLANTCPLIGGDAVFKARNLVARVHPGLLYDDVAICSEDAENRNADLNVDNKSFALTPNPASEYIVMKVPNFNTDTESTASYVVFDAFGRSVVSETVSTKEVVIRTQALFPGTYFIRLTTESGENITETFIKQ